MGYTDSSVHKRSREAVVAHKWHELKRHLGDFTDRRWLIQFHTSSITFTHQKLRHHVRVTPDAVIYVDKRITKFDYKSDVICCADVLQASKAVRSLLNELS